ncbi:MAG: sensor histidine kinase [Flavobacteriales bacterium]
MTPSDINKDSSGHIDREKYDSVIKENQLLRAVLNQLPSELVVVDTNSCYLFVNKAAVKDDEIREWMIGKTDVEFWKRKNRNSDLSVKRRQAFEHVMHTGEDLQFEESFHVGTPQEKHYVRLHRPSLTDGEQQYVIVYGQEITELKKSEERLKAQNAELEKVNHELDQFVYSASHNLRAPLLSIKGLLGLIEMDETDAPARNRFIGEIYKSIQRLDATIKDIIDYSKNARLEIAPVCIEIEQLIRNTHEDLKFYEGTTVALELVTHLSTGFYSDERRLKSIIHNIMSNSVKYSDPAKEASWLRVEIEANAQCCIITFADNGKGISPENLSRVFDMFYRGTTDRSGSGLGLYIVKEMTERIGGSVQLESAPGAGTTITLNLPNMQVPS